MPKYLSNLREYIVNGLREFSEHPIGYSFSAVKDFAKDYWDAGAMLLAGFAFNDYQNQVLGDFREPVMLVTGIGGLVGAGRSADRFTRNFFAGITSLFGFWTKGTDVPLSVEIGNLASAALIGYISLSFDMIRRRKIKNSETYQHSSSTEPLEKLIE